MQRMCWLLLLLAVSIPAWADKKITVEELKDKLAALSQAQMGDGVIATQLKTVELSEQLTEKARQGLLQYLPGSSSTEQLDILAGRSAFLAPPASEIPADPAPDAAAQQAILGKASEYVAKVFPHSPHVTVSRTTYRYQSEPQNTSSSAGLTVLAPDPTTRLMETRTDTVESDKGVDKPESPRRKRKGDTNGLVSERVPGPVMIVALDDSSTAGKLDWLRWEMIDGKKAAGFAFAVDKKRSHFEVNYCCFPVRDTAEGAAGGHTKLPSPADFQSVITWKPFRKTVGYHGQIFIDPDSGAILRVITFADLKPSDNVHGEIIRIDYAPVVVDGKEYVLPWDNYTINEIVPNGDNMNMAYTARRTLLRVIFRNYRAAGAGQK